GRTRSARAVLLTGPARRLPISRWAVVGLTVIGILIAVNLVVPIASPYSYRAPPLDEMFGAPSAQHWLGTDHLGRDNLARVAYGGGISFLVSGTAVLVQTVLGVTVGLIAGAPAGLTHAAPI